MLSDSLKAQPVDSNPRDRFYYCQSSSFFFLSGIFVRVKQMWWRPLAISSKRPPSITANRHSSGV